MSAPRKLSHAQAQHLLNKIPGWTLGKKKIVRRYAMRDFSAAVNFLRAIANVANAQDHHPDAHLTGYRRLRLVLSTHSIGALSHKDFRLAASIDALPKQLKIN